VGDPGHRDQTGPLVDESFELSDRHFSRALRCDSELDAGRFLEMFIEHVSGEVMEFVDHDIVAPLETELGPAGLGFQKPSTRFHDRRRRRSDVGTVEIDPFRGNGKVLANSKPIGLTGCAARPECRNSRGRGGSTEELPAVDLADFAGRAQSGLDI
jgi:hypothetical protein